MPDNAPKTLSCPSCGAPLDFDGRSPVIRCKFCSNVSLVPGVLPTPAKTGHALLEEIRRLAKSGKLARAVQIYRESFSVGMEEAKDAVKALKAGRLVETPTVSLQVPEEEESVLKEIQELLRAGDKIQAVKRYREVHDVSLAKAGNAVDRIEAQMEGKPLPAVLEAPRVSVTLSQQHTGTSGCWMVYVIVAAILLMVGGSLAFALLQPGGPFVPRMVVIGPSVMLHGGGEEAPDMATVLYNVDDENRLVGRVDAEKGELDWKAEPLPGDGFVQSLVSDGEKIYVASGAYLLAFQVEDGSLLWQVKMPDTLNCAEDCLVIKDGQVISLTLDKSLQAYAVQSGQEIWSRRLTGYDDHIRVMADWLVILDQVGDGYTYSLVFLDPVDGQEQRVTTPACEYGGHSADTLEIDSGIIYDEMQDELYLVYGDFTGCVERYDIKSGEVNWQTTNEDGFYFSAHGFSWLLTETHLYFGYGQVLYAVDKDSGAMQPLLEGEDHDFVPLAVLGENLVVRARRTRGSERFELWAVNVDSGELAWQIDLESSRPMDPPHELAGLIDQDGSGWTWHAETGGFLWMDFRAEPTRLVIKRIDPVDGSSLSESEMLLRDVTGDFFSSPEVIGWWGETIYFLLDSVVYSVDVSTETIQFVYK